MATKEQKPPSKRQQTMAARVRRREQREADRHEKEAIRQQCAEQGRGRPPPPEFQTWGAVRTAAWASAVQQCAAAGRVKRLTIARGQRALQALKTAMHGSLEDIMAMRQEEGA